MHEELEIGTQLELPESARDGEQDLRQKFEDARYAFAGASRMLRENEQAYFAYIRAVLPHLGGYTFSVNHVTWKVTIIRRDDE